MIDNYFASTMNGIIYDANGKRYASDDTLENLIELNFMDRHVRRLSQFVG